MVHSTDRELQIRLAELQADVQINLTSAFGFLAGFLALTVGYLEIYFGLTSEQSLMRNVFSVLVVVLVVACAFCFRYFVNKARVARRQMKELRKEYVW